jgi:hypothetical protein
MRMDSDSKVRPIRPPRRCRGIPFGDGNYAGCAFGDGAVPPFTPPCDCTRCFGSGIEDGPLPATDLHQMLTEMELTLDICSETCPYCNSVNVIPGVSKVLMFTCRECGKAVVLDDGEQK